MAYTINRYNNATLTVVEDGTIDQTTDLKLVGKNYAGYGEIQNENFVFLLENFSSANPPPKAISGQIWFDTGNSKLKFYDGTQWRTTGGAEISGTQPAGLSQGDFWWDTNNEQLYAYNGTDFVLVGPQDAGDGITQMQSRSVRDTDGQSRSIITATVNDEIIFVINAHVGNNPADPGFTIDSTDAENAIGGFDRIRPGITLKNTVASTAGVTSTTHRFHGTATNAEKLNGKLASEYVTTSAGTPTVFTEITNFQTDAGIAIGTGLDLKIFVENDDEGVIANDIDTTIKFRAKQAGLNQNIIELSPGSVLPGRNNADTGVNSVDIGSMASPFDDMYAGNFWGTAEKASALIMSGVARVGDVGSANTAVGNTVAVRDAAGNLNAVKFQGTATSAQYADLAENYTTETAHPEGTIMAVCTHEDHETDLANVGDVVIGVVSLHPAYLMNSQAAGQALALKGRVPVRVIDPVKKGDSIFLAQDGIGSPNGQGELVGVALETDSNEIEKLVECVLKV